MRTFTTSIAALALPATLLLAALPANAASVTIKDGAGDVRVATLSDAIDPKKMRNAPMDKALKDHDILKTKVAHTRKQLVVQTKFRSLAGEKIVQISTLGIKTPKQTFAYQWSKTSINGDDQVTSILVNSKEKKVACKVAVKDNAKKAVRTIRIPRKCLKNPAWVRVSSTATTGTMSHTRIDGAHGKKVNGLTKKIAVG
ncbi:hypothetical protein [Nocardioides massiliensis]|uniref:Uncharacterized protein n=1 Tax=Nocardioides massiliensis TaxID=1325935 RepID=A0ABT9NM14_9ACTN|nr:hypothetical protein [Nocardioides massiliensis]MDP9821433.1 hypothetical protein [Nocardioides massiliensis]